jgi:hypothetical protein
MINKNRDAEFTNWFETSNDSALKSVNINQFSKNLEVYDEEIQYFNNRILIKTL